MLSVFYLKIQKDKQPWKELAYLSGILLVIQSNSSSKYPYIETCIKFSSFLYICLVSFSGNPLYPFLLAQPRFRFNYYLKWNSSSFISLGENPISSEACSIPLIVSLQLSHRKDFTSP